MQVTEFLVDRHDEDLLQVADDGAFEQIFLEDLRFDRSVGLLIQLHIQQSLPLKHTFLLLVHRLRQVRTEPYRVKLILPLWALDSIQVLDIQGHPSDSTLIITQVILKLDQGGKEILINCDEVCQEEIDTFIEIHKIVYRMPSELVLQGLAELWVYFSHSGSLIKRIN